MMSAGRNSSSFWRPNNTPLERLHYGEALLINLANHIPLLEALNFNNILKNFSIIHREGHMKPLSVKVFSECTQNINLPNELKINEWLRTNPDLEIVHVVQSESMARVTERDIERNLTITIFYRY
jgi:hypothetical protein